MASTRKGYHTDGHLHLFIDGAPIRSSGIEEFKNTLLRYNIGEIYDMGSRDGLGLKFRRYFEDSPLILRSCGYALYRYGTYGRFLGRPVKDARDIKEYIKDLYGNKADFIKVINSGIMTASGRISEGGFSGDELRIIVDEAHERGLKVFCHVSSPERIIEALNAGVDSVEHGFFMPEEALHMMREGAVSWTPTVYALKCFIKGPGRTDREVLEGVLKDHMEMVSIAARLGIEIRAGSDSGASGIRHGHALLEEKRILSALSSDKSSQTP